MHCHCQNHRGIDPSRVLALSFSAQMQCCLPVDKEGRPLHPAMIWADQRAGQQASQLSRRLGADRMYAITGHRVSASYSLEKLMWLKDNKPEVYRATCKMLQAKDFIIYRLTGRFLTDYSDASGTNALDLKNLCWSGKSWTPPVSARISCPSSSPPRTLQETSRPRPAALWA